MKALAVIYCSIFCFSPLFTQAQLCTGSLGDPVVNITFGSGAGAGQPLSNSQTSYPFISGDCPKDGYYTIAKISTSCFSSSWHTITNDHTGNVGGYFMLVNASLQPGIFYKDTIKGLCSNVTYEFASWVLNMLRSGACSPNPIKPNLTFSIEDLLGNIIQQYTSGNLASYTNPTWEQVGFNFKMPKGLNNIVLKIINNAPGGCGNDLALDDITFRPCGPIVTSEFNSNYGKTLTVCENEVSQVIINTSVSSGFSTPVYIWQESISDAGFATIVAPNESFYIKSLKNAPFGNYKYRLGVSEPENSTLNQCRVYSNIVELNHSPNPRASITSPDEFCLTENITLAATGADTFYWKSQSGQQYKGSPVIIPLAGNQHLGNYYLTGVNSFGCKNQDTIAIKLHAKPVASVSFIDSTVCNGSPIQLRASGGTQYLWLPSNGLSQTNIYNPISTINNSISYKVIVSNLNSCSDTASIQLTIADKPKVNAGKDIFIVNGQSALLNGKVEGRFVNSYWQELNSTIQTPGKNLTVQPTVSSTYLFAGTSPFGCGTVMDTLKVDVLDKIFIANSFTPNGDGKNDTWVIPSITVYPKYTIQVYNRFGNLVYQTKNKQPNWDGKYKGVNQPSGAYVYVIGIENVAASYKGTLILIR